LAEILPHDGLTLLLEERKKHRWVIVPPVISALGAFILFFFAGTIIDFLQPIISGGG